MTVSRSQPRAWLFGLLILPFGIMIGINATPVPFLLARAGVPVDKIASILALLPLPGLLVFLWAPLVDTGLRRRTWLALAGVFSAVPDFFYFPLIGSAHLVAVTTLLLASGGAASVNMVACGGLMVRTLSGRGQARASAWWQAGVLGGGVLGGAAILWLAARLPLTVVGIIAAAMMAWPGILAFSIAEAKPSRAPKILPRLSRIAGEFWGLMKEPKRRWSALLLASPAGTGAALNLLPAIASHYGVGAGGVIWVNGVSGGFLMAAGALAGLLIPGHADRRKMYATAAALNAVALLLPAASNTAIAYVVGASLYLLSNGFCQTWFIALLTETVGGETPEASTLFGALNALGTVPVMTMTFLDGQGYRLFSTPGLLLTDALASLGVCAIVFLAFVVTGMRAKDASIAP